MRKRIDPQATIWDIFSDHPFAKELEAISKRLDRHPRILLWVEEDSHARQVQETGRDGLTLDSTIRAALLKQLMGLSYLELEFHLWDSAACRAFCRIGHKSPSTSAMQANIARIRASTWEKINRALLGEAVEQGLEKGRTIRTDSTVMETNIHEPSDSSLLWDCVRSMTRLLIQARDELSLPVGFRDHRRVCKKLSRNLSGLGKPAERKKIYRKLIAYAHKTATYLVQAVNRVPSTSPWIQAWQQEAGELLPLVDQVISQAHRRVILGEKVPAPEKLVSIFEPHSDVICKGGRKIQYGHKLNLTTGKSGLVLDLVVEEGNPADSAVAVEMVRRQMAIYGRAPRQVSFDAGYGSKANLQEIKEIGVKDVAFHRKKGLGLKEMVKSSWVYRMLVRFRAGIEATIGTLKQRYGWRRCTWKGWEHFKSYAWASVVAYNLLTLARLSI